MLDRFNRYEKKDHPFFQGMITLKRSYPRNKYVTDKFNSNKKYEITICLQRFLGLQKRLDSN